MLTPRVTNAWFPKSARGNRKRWVVFVGDCQAQALATVYLNHLAFEKDDLVTFVDSRNINTSAPVLRNADVVVSQLFHYATRMFESQANIGADDLAAGCERIVFPSVAAGFYWPFTADRHILAPKGKRRLPYGRQLADRFLNEQIEKGLDPEVALQRYLELDLASVVNLDKLYDSYLARQHKLDSKCGFDVAKLIAENFRSERLFLTFGHPNLSIFNLVARQVFQLLGIPDLQLEQALAAQHLAPFPPHIACPIHPQVIEYFGLTFVDDKTAYPIWNEGHFTFREYVLRYMRHECSLDLQQGLYGHGSPAARLEQLDRGLLKAPNSAEGWCKHAEFLLQSGRAQEAYASASRSCALDPRNPYALVVIIRALMALKDNETLKNFVDEARLRFPFNSQIHRVAARVSQRYGSNDEAIHEARLGVQLQCGDPLAYNVLGEILGNAGDLAGAEQAYRKAIEVHADQRKFSGPTADEDGYEIVEVKKGVSEFWISLAEILERQGRHKEAVEIIKTLNAEKLSNSQLVVRLADFLLRQGQLSDAETAYRKAIEIKPGVEKIQKSLAFVLLRLERVDEALNILQQLVKDGTPDLQVHARLGEALAVKEAKAQLPAQR